MVDDDDAVVIDISDSVTPPEQPRARVTARWWLTGLIAVALVGWLVRGPARPAPPPPPPAPTTAVRDVPAHFAAVELSSALGATSATVLVPTRPPTLVDTATRTRVPILGLPPVAGRYDVTELGDGRFLVTATDPAGSAQAYLVIGSRAQLVAVGDHVVPGADGASVLVTRTTGVRQVQRYGLDGSPWGDPVDLAEGEDLAFETVAGWVFASLDGGQLRDPAQPRQPGGFFTPYDATPTELAYVPWDGGLIVAGLAPGGRFTYLKPVTLPGGSRVLASAALRGDGRRLAVHTVIPPDAAHAVHVVDLETGTWTAMPGTPVRVAADGEALTVAWTGDVLAVVTATGEAVLWRPGDPQVYAVPEQVTPRV